MILLPQSPECGITGMDQNAQLLNILFNIKTNNAVQEAFVIIKDILAISCRNTCM
jgi:hypothetical protein